MRALYMCINNVAAFVHQMVLIETVVTGIVDEFPRLGLNWCLRLMTTISVACFFMFLGLPQCTQVLRDTKPTATSL